MSLHCCKHSQMEIYASAHNARPFRNFGTDVFFSCIHTRAHMIHTWTHIYFFIISYIYISINQIHMTRFCSSVFSSAVLCHRMLRAPWHIRYNKTDIKCYAAVSNMQKMHSLFPVHKLPESPKMEHSLHPKTNKTKEVIVEFHSKVNSHWSFNIWKKYAYSLYPQVRWKEWYHSDISMVNKKLLWAK